MPKCFSQILAAIVSAFIGVAVASPATQQLPQAKNIRHVMERVADWQLAQTIRRPRGWIAGVWYAGLYATEQTTGQKKYYRAMRQIGDNNGWALGKRQFHADDYAVGQMYIQMYQHNHNEKMLAPTKKRLNAFMRHPWPKSLKWRPGVAAQAWAWCDALFMAAPTFAYMTSATGNRKYLDNMSKDWWLVTDYLYDKKQRLYHRDSSFFHRRDANGQEIFWSRGNGGVMAGLIRVLSNMPNSYPTRSKFILLYKQMAARVITLQSTDGTWHPSLLDPSNPDIKETSGTGLFVYALAWGINHHVLKREPYLPHVLDGWHALVGAVNEQGRLGFVQSPGDAPSKVSADSSAPYGSGAFLLAGSEIAKLVMSKGTSNTSIGGENKPLTFQQPKSHSKARPRFSVPPLSCVTFRSICS